MRRERAAKVVDRIEKTESMRNEAVSSYCSVKMYSTANISESTVLFADAACAADESTEWASVATVVRRGAAETTEDTLTAEAPARAAASIVAAMKEGTGGGAFDDDICCRCVRVWVARVSE